jgi:hypothetical protein
MKDDDINVEMNWAGKGSWVCFLLVLLGVITAFDFQEIHFFTPTAAASTLWCWTIRRTEDHFAGNRGSASLIQVVHNIG